MINKLDRDTFEQNKTNLKEEVYFRLQNPDQTTSLVKTLFCYKIHHSSYYGNVFSTSSKDRDKLETMGFITETVKPINLSGLSLEERNAIKSRSRSNWLSSRDAAIDELLAKYGN